MTRTEDWRSEAEYEFDVAGRNGEERDTRRLRVICRRGGGEVEVEVRRVGRMGLDRVIFPCKDVGKYFSAISMYPWCHVYQLTPCEIYPCSKEGR